MRSVLILFFILCASAAHGQGIPFPGPGMLTSGGGGGGSPIAYIDGVCGGSSDGDTFTTGTFNSTGANFVALGISYNYPNTVVISDNMGNNSGWSCTVVPNEIVNAFGSTICFKEGAVTGSGHTITLTGTNHFASVCAKAFSNVKTTSARDAEGGAIRNFGIGTTLATGSITPSQDGELILSHAAWSFTATLAVNSSMIITNQIQLIQNQHYGGALAHLIQTSASAINPTWSGWSSTGGGDGGAVSITSFRVSP